MPITPFHMGPALALKAATGRRFSVLVFGVSQVLIDIEPLLGLIRDRDVLHGWSHTLTGATAIALVAAEAGRPLAEWWLRVWTGKPAEISRTVAHTSAFVGTFSHLLLDGMMHLDMLPFAPLTNANPLLGTMSVPALYAFCIVTGVVGALAAYVTELRLLTRAIRALAGGRSGDAAAFKAAAAGAQAHPAVAARLRALADPLPRIDLERLRALPEGTFGRAYATFMDAHGLRPFVVSPAVAGELAATHLLEVRYPLLHDAFHVLLGFDTSLAGELGVWSFVAGQRYSTAYERAALYGRVLYPLVAPWQARKLRAHGARGRRLASASACVIAEPLERYWADPLPAVRARLGIDVDAG